MALDPSIFARFAPKSVADYDLENAQVQGAQQTNALNALKIQQGMRADQESQRLLNEQTGVRNALSGIVPGQGEASDQLDQRRINALYGVGTQTATGMADKLRTQMLEQQKTAAQANEQNTKALQTKVGIIKGGLGYVYQNPTAQAANSAIDLVEKQTGQDLSSYRAEIAQLQTPDQFKQWAAGHALDMEKQLPSFATSNTGQFTQTRAENPVLGTASVVNSVQNTVSPDALEKASTSRQNNAANIAKDYAIAGLNADGTPSGTVESMAQMIAAGKSAPITGFALARPQGQMVMQRVMQINPNFDATDYAAKSKAARDFGTGSQGNAMRSFAVAGQHLDQLGTLVDALGNRDTQIVNKIANAYAEQTGSTAPTNFDAAKDIVSKEVVKAIVAGGGGVSEREELARLMSNAKSPAQLKGVITQYRALMGAQHDALLQQRRATGLPDSTLPAYSGDNAAPTMPADIAAILKKHGSQ